MPGIVKARRRAFRGTVLVVFWSGAASSGALVPARAHAASADARTGRAEPASSQRAAARRLVLEGDGLYAKQSYAQALQRYTEAYRIMHVPTVGVEVVKVQKALGKLLEATQTAREVSALPQQPGEPAVFDQARLQAARDVIALSASTPTLLLDVAPRGVLFVVQIDGVSPSGETPFPLNPGAHHVRVSADGFQNVDLDVTLREAERQTLTVTLFPVAGVSGGALPGVSAAGASAAGVSGAAATPAGSAAAGPAAAPSASAPPQRKPAQRSGSGRTLGWVGIGVAGAGVAAGTFAGINAFQTKPDCPNDLCSLDQRQDIHTSKQMGYIADVSFGVAIVAGALGIWALASSSSGEDAQSAAVPVHSSLARAAEPALAVTSIDLGTGPIQLRVSGGF